MVDHGVLQAVLQRAPVRADAASVRSSICHLLHTDACDLRVELSDVRRSYQRRASPGLVSIATPGQRVVDAGAIAAIAGLSPIRSAIHTTLQIRCAIHTMSWGKENG